MSQHPEWLNSIDDPGIYPHPVSEIQLIQTHISWVILTGDWAYKLKKPVNFGFVDFSTLELRQAACLEEVRLNRRTAPSLYDGVVPMVEGADGPQFGGSGLILEYAVRMRQFAQADLFEQCLARNELSIDLIKNLARAVAELHAQADIATPESPFGTPELIRSTVQACLDELAKAPLPEALGTQLIPLKEWVTSEWHRLNPSFISRKQQGWIRECHGDLHLGNIVLYRGKPTLFDCLEFNPGLRWIDVMSDVAFLVMDLHGRKASSLAWRTLNIWLEQTGDYQGLSVLKYYLAYRALVRAKVASIRLRQPEISAEDQTRQHDLLKSYIELATSVIRPVQPAIVLMHGVSGSGKSFVARRLVDSFGAIQIRSDVERKRLMGTWPAVPPVPPTESEMYSTETTRQTYLRLKSLAGNVVESGYPVIVDAAFLKQTDRQAFASLAAELGIPFVIAACHAPVAVMQERVSKRQQIGQDASDADVAVLQQQLATAEPLTTHELGYAIELDTNSSDLDAMVKSIRNRLTATP
jgi:aminoglycoside phosphotransferase family enzyme/predicted kinase